MKHKHLTTHQHKMIKQKATPDTTVLELAAIVKADRNAVYAALKRNNLPYRKQRDRSAKKETVTKWFTWGWAKGKDAIFA